MNLTRTSESSAPSSPTMPTPSAPPAAQFRIGELARRVGATPRAVRYYEELGLLPSGRRPPGRHRLYDEADEARLRELLSVRELLGLSLTELRTWMEAEAARASLREQWYAGAPSDRERVRIADEALRHVDTQIELVRVRRAALEELEDHLVGRRRRLREVLGERHGDRPVPAATEAPPDGEAR
jgi:MerR family transcriptional regulator, repressor of the yfmOP operon